MFRTSFEGGPLWPVLSFRSVGPKCQFPLDKIVVPSTALLYPAYRTITKRAVAWVGFVQPECTVPLGTCYFRNFCWMESALRIRNEQRNTILMTRHCYWLQPIRSTTQIWVMTRHQYGISAPVSRASFGGETSGDVGKCRLPSQAIRVYFC